MQNWSQNAPLKGHPAPSQRLSQSPSQSPSECHFPPRVAGPVAPNRVAFSNSCNKCPRKIFGNVLVLFSCCRRTAGTKISIIPDQTDAKGSSDHRRPRLDHSRLDESEPCGGCHSDHACVLSLRLVTVCLHALHLNEGFRRDCTFTHLSRHVHVAPSFPARWRF